MVPRHHLLSCPPPFPRPSGPFPTQSITVPGSHPPLLNSSPDGGSSCTNPLDDSCYRCRSSYRHAYAPGSLGTGKTGRVSLGCDIHSIRGGTVHRVCVVIHDVELFTGVVCLPLMGLLQNMNPRTDWLDSTLIQAFTFSPDRTPGENAQRVLPSPMKVKYTAIV